MKMLMSILLMLMIFGDFSCKESPPQPYIQAVFLSAEDVGVTDAFLRVHLTRADSLSTILIKRNGKVVLTARMGARTDTLLFDDLLSPNQTYIYKAYRTFQVPFDSSDGVTITTMDTSSHSFSFQIDTLGDGNSSVLRDVAIVNDTCIYAVGEINLKDSLGQWVSPPFNAAMWDGKKWNLQRIMYLFQGQQYYVQLRSVYALGVNDVWFAGNGIMHWNGEKYISLEIPTSVWGPNWINKMWGSSGSDLYIVGTNGSIAHFDGTTWQKLESGTTLPIKDIYGARDPRSGEYEILCVSADQALPGHSQVLSIESTTVREVATNPLWEPWGIWFVPGRQYIIVGDGLWQTRSLSGTWLSNTELPALFKDAIRGQGLNDIVVCGDFWLLAHNNGVSWRTYFPRTSGSLGGIDVKENFLVAVGFIENQAVAIRGRR